MRIFDAILGKKPSTQEQGGQGDIVHALPMGLRLGGCVAFDQMMYRAASGAFTSQLPDGHQPIQCYGHAPLGDGAELHRFYVEDDAYLQVMTVGQSVDAIQAFVFHETRNPPTKAAFQQFVTSGDLLGPEEIEYLGKTWYRVTSHDSPGRVPPMAFDEVLYRGMPARKDDDLTHYAVVYGRHIQEIDREELLLITAEDSGPNDFCITFAIGLALTQADLEIT